MPLYEYQCQECGEVHETIQRMADPPLTICSHCGGALKKLFSAPAIQFKGSGFYITDYGKGNGAGARNAQESSKSESSKSESSNADSSKADSSKSESSSSKGDAASKASAAKSTTASGAKS